MNYCICGRGGKETVHLHYCACGRCCAREDETGIIAISMGT